jgi:hypothetical protein
VLALDPEADGKYERLHAYPPNIPGAEGRADAGLHVLKEAEGTSVESHAQLTCSPVVAIVFRRNNQL